MHYTGLERHTTEEVIRIAYGSNNRVAIELAKRLSDKIKPPPPVNTRAERAALAGVNPTPLNIGE